MLICWKTVYHPFIFGVVNEKSVKKAVPKQKAFDGVEVTFPISLKHKKDMETSM